MKGGHRPIHIQRWSPADYQADEHVRLLYLRRAWCTLTFYRTFLDCSHLAGGDLPADSETLCALLSMPKRDVERALAFCLGRLIERDGDRLYQKRVRRDVAHEIEFRAKQSARANQRWHPPGGCGGNATAEAPRKTPQSPPSPSPSPAPDARRQAASNPLLAGKRPELESECLRLVSRMAALTGEDPLDVIARASGFEGAKRTAINPATMTDDRLANTVRDLRADVAAEERKAAAKGQKAVAGA